MITAFAKWFHREFASDPELGAIYLFQMAFETTGGYAWEYLEKTGDKQYTRDIFRKAAKLILQEVV
jgi:hypothetical protein